MNSIFHFALFFSLFSSVMIAIHWYIWRRLVRDSHMPAPWNTLARNLVVTLGISLPATLVLSRYLPFDVSRVVTFIPYSWMGTSMLLLFALGAIDAARGLFFVSKKLFIPTAAPMNPSRRKAMHRLLAGTTCVGVTSLAGVSLVNGTRKPTVHPITISLSRLPAHFDQMTVVHISDLHIGITVGDRWVAELVDRINALSPDLVVITGDLTDGMPQKIAMHVAPLKNLDARHGVFFVTGNHEYYSDANGWITELKKWGITTLQNQMVPITRGTATIQLAGVNDFKAGNLLPDHAHDVDLALKDARDDTLTILLAHQPLSIHDAARAGVDLVLSGHTHGGQIWPFSLLVPLQQPYNKGLHRHTDATQIYINQGTFLWGPPMRLGTECEITYITLKST